MASIQHIQGVSRWVISVAVASALAACANGDDGSAASAADTTTPTAATADTATASAAAAPATTASTDAATAAAATTTAAADSTTADVEEDAARRRARTSGSSSSTTKPATTSTATTTTTTTPAATTTAASTPTPSAAATTAVTSTAAATTTTTTTTAASTGSMVPVGVGGSWTMTFSDEFNGSSLNTAVWNDQIWYGDRNNDGTVNYGVSNGTFKIWPALNRSGQFFDRAPNTDGKWSQQYGYFEARMKLPKGKGAWPSFWLFNHFNSGAQAIARPEIDVIEAYSGAGGDPWSTADFRPNAYGATVHTDGGQVDGSGTPIGQYSPGGTKIIPAGADLSADFHVYGVKWDANTITFYFDGKQAATVSTAMRVPMFMIMGLWFGSASGTPNTSQTPMGPTNSVEFDYVRAWKAS